MIEVPNPAGARRCVLLRDLGALVGAAVVDEDELPVAVGLGVDARERVGEELLLVAEDHHDGQMRAHRRLSARAARSQQPRAAS